MAEKKERFGIGEATGALVAVAGYSMSPLPKICGTVGEGVGRFIDVSSDVVDVVKPIPKLEDNVEKEPSSELSLKLSENGETSREKQESVQLTKKEKQEQEEAYTPTRTEKAKQTFDDAQRKLNPYRSELPYADIVVDKPVDLRSKIMGKTKGWMGKMFGSEKMQEDTKAQDNPEYTQHYNRNEDVQSAGYDRIEEINEELRKEKEPEAREELVGEKEEIAKVVEDSKDLTTEQIKKGEQDETYVAVQDRANELGLQPPSYAIYDASGIILGGIIATYVGAKIGRTLERTVNTGVSIVNGVGNFSRKAYNTGAWLVGLMGKALNRRTNDKSIGLNKTLDQRVDSSNETPQYLVGAGLEDYTVENGDK